jgi:myo-inositol 2-dehydrogenase / D-chiro-inositol 1-dehydrogenase
MEWKIMSFKICAVGCGYMAFNGHGPSYRKYADLNPDVELTACCDVDEERALSFKHEFGFLRHYTDMDLMLDTERPQAVCLIVPVNLTFPLSVRIFQKGYPLLLEKPPGLDKHEAMEMIRSANKWNIPNMVAFNRRFMPLVIKLKEMLQQNGLDKSLSIDYRMLRVGRKDPDFSTTAIHGIDVVRYLAASDYRTVHFNYQDLDIAGRNIVNIFMDCEFESGATARFGICPVAGTVAERLEINSLQNTFHLNLPLAGSKDMPGRLSHFYNGNTVLELNGINVSGNMDEFVLNGFYDENKVFFDDIRYGRKPVDDILSGLQSVEIADCIRNRLTEYRSAAK